MKKYIRDKIEKMNVGTIVTIVLFITLLVLGIFFIQQVFSQELEFIIYENVCHSESICNYTYNDSVYRFAENEFGELYKVYQNISEIKSKEISCDTFFWFLNFYDEEVGKYINEHDLLSNEFLRNETTCEEVKINEILNCSGNYLCRDKPECCLNYYFQYGELNSNWLDEYAEWCFTNENEWVGDSDNFKKYGCFKYKIGNYTIEVLK
jgi:hypothetical protein